MRTRVVTVGARGDDARAVEERVATDERRRLQEALDRGEPFSLELRAGPDDPADWLLVQGARADGELLVLVHDASAWRRADEGARLLADVSDLLSGPVDVEARLGDVERLVAPRWADACGIVLWREDGLGFGSLQQLLTGEARVLPVFDDAVLSSLVRDPEQLNALFDAGPVSAMVAPLTGRAPLGAVVLIGGAWRRPYEDDDLPLARELGRRIGLAVENHRLVRREAAAQAALERVLDVAPEFAAGRSPEAVAQAICEAAEAAFHVDAVSLWRVEDDVLRVIARSHPTPELPIGTTLSIDQVPEVANDVLRRRPSFVPTPYVTQDLGDYGTRAHVRSALLVPVAVERTVRWMLSLTWHDRVAEPTPGMLAAASRYADQAGLALEQAQRLVVQAEADRLNAALLRLLELSPAFRSGTASPADVATGICEAAVQTFDTDAAAIWTVDDDGFSLLARWPSTGPTAHDHLPLRTAVAQGLRTPRTSFVRDLQDEEDEEWAARARESSTHSVLRVPLAHRGQVDAVLTLSWRRRVPEPSAGTLALAQRFGDQAALALDEARLRLARDEAAALHAQLEAGLMPRLRGGLGRHPVATRYRAGERRLLLGGDFLDAVELPDGTLAIVVGDVSGHGAEAAALGATLRAAWRALTLAGASGHDALQTLEAVIRYERASIETFATLVLASVDADGTTCRVTLAGHPPPFVLEGRTTIPALPVGPPVGCVDEPSWTEADVELAPGARLLFFTDGLIDGRRAPGSYDRLGSTALGTVAAGMHHLPGDALLEQLHDAARDANGGDLPDDVAMLIAGPWREGAPTPNVPASAGSLGVALRLPAVAESVPAARARVVELVEALGLGDELRDAVALATTEAAANVVTHAYVGSGAEDQVLEVDAWPEQGRLRVVVRDYGGGMRPRADSPGLGLGLGLIGTFADEFEVRTTDAEAGSTEIVMLFADRRVRIPEPGDA
jgi:serine phosphatase RsbU (regulator of sigma subunit)/anti-sigma regulatory factor (Ser/Thr protein kinase)